MRRRRSSDSTGDTASNLGNAMDELMRHQPSLKTGATAAIIKLLEEVCAMGRDPKYICWKANGGVAAAAKAEAAGGGAAAGVNSVCAGNNVVPPAGNDQAGGSSDEEEEEEDEQNSNQV